MGEAAGIKLDGSSNGRSGEQFIPRAPNFPNYITEIVRGVKLAREGMFFSHPLLPGIPFSRLLRRQKCR